MGTIIFDYIVSGVSPWKSRVTSEIHSLSILNTEIMQIGLSGLPGKYFFCQSRKFETITKSMGH